MIAPTTVRIGNWMKYKFNTKLMRRDYLPWSFGRVTQISLKSFQVDYSHNSKDVHRQVEGISLDTDLLLKAGFSLGITQEQGGIDRVYGIQICENTYLEMGGGATWRVVCGYSTPGAPLWSAPPRFVHELQNLFFALSGKELEFDLNLK